ncbi:hypothetical protein D9X30_3896 [Cupriavidus sp. U2]|nr:hypothetical protein D9X30_3896 [Cupriavidus sp. U2]
MNSTSPSSASSRRASRTGSLPPQPPQPPESVDTAGRQPSKARPQRLAWLTGLLSATLLVLNTLACFVPIVPLALLKLAVPTPAVRRRVDPWLNGIATGWVSRNTRWIARLQPQIWDVQGNTGSRLDDWYLVNCNH